MNLVIYALAGIGTVAVALFIIVALTDLMESFRQRQGRLIREQSNTIRKLNEECDQLREDLDDLQLDLEAEQEARASDMRRHAEVVAATRKPPRKRK